MLAQVPKEPHNIAISARVSLLFHFTIRLLSISASFVPSTNEVVFVLVGSDADLTLLRKLGVKTEAGRALFSEVPVYDPETFETDVPGIGLDRRHSLLDTALAKMPR